MNIKLKHFLSAFVVILIGLMTIQAQTIHYITAGDGTLETAIAAAASGDIIELVDSGGLYAHSSSDYMVIDKTLIIRAATGLADQPIIKITKDPISSARIFEIRAGGNLTLKGLEMDCRGPDGVTLWAKNAIRSQDVADTSGTFHFTLIVDDCYMHHSLEAMVKMHRYTIGDTIRFTNCIFDEAYNEAVLFRESSSNLGPDIRFAEFTNCTFSRIGREALYAEFSNPVIRFNHCTFDSISWRENKRIIYPTNITDVEIKNCIFSNQLGTNTQSIALYGNSTISYSDTFNVASVSLRDASTIGAGMLDVDPLYTDPVNDDYTLQPNSPVLGMADDGYAMGDLRWDPNYGMPVVIPVAAGDGTLQAAVTSASEGDTLELISSGGVYRNSTSDYIVIDKTLIIRARTGLAQMPIIRNTNISASSARLFEIRAGGNLTLKGLDLDCRAANGGDAHAKNAIRSQDVADTTGAFHFKLFVMDCKLHNSKEALVKAHRFTIGDTLVFENCIFDEAYNEAILFRESTSNLGPDIRYTRIENCTFTKIGREALYIEYSDPVVQINHCTFDSVSYREDKRIIYPRNVNDVQIKNCIFTNQGGTNTQSLALYGTSTIDYCDLFNVTAVSLNGSAASGDSLFNFDPLYNDPSSYDYRLALASPARDRADDGQALGDLRWEILPTQYYLNLVTVGRGIVTLDPAGGVYDPGTVVTMTAIPDFGWEFSQWTGNVFPPNANPVNITMNATETVTCTFTSLAPQVVLTVDTLGLGHVELDPEPSNGTYDQGTLVTLTAVPQTNWTFVQWEGDLTGSTNPITAAIDSNMHVTARFASIFTQYELTVNVDGQGNVTLTPEPILGTYDSSTVVSLLAEPSLGWEFSGWSGDLTGTVNPDTVVMDSNLTVTATFSEIVFPGHALEIDTTWDLWDAVEFANNNSYVDSIILITDAGLYACKSTHDMAVRSPLTIIADTGLVQKPVIINMDPSASSDDIFRVFDDFTLKGVILDGGHPLTYGPKYAIRLRHYDNSDSVKVGTNVTVMDCEFRDFFQNKILTNDGHVFKIDVWVLAGTIKFENCTFVRTGYEAIRISDLEKWPSSKTLDSLIVRNCTFVDIDAECIRYYSDLDPATPDAPVIVEHLTVDNSATRIMFLKNSGGAIVRDIIISNSRLSGHGRDSDLLDAQGNTGVPSFVSHIDTFQVLPVPILSSDGQVDTTTIYGFDPLYRDRANLDFTLLAGSPAYGKAHDGTALGDLRWVDPTVGIALPTELIPTEYKLEQNYPNPFNPSTTIEFAIKEPGLTTLKVYDILGRLVITLVNGQMQAGYYKVAFHDPKLATGIYFCHLKSGKFESIKKMLLVK